jgi:diketogulonate reductase-like aldo/keto reductase
MTHIPNITLNNGRHIPTVGFGVWRVADHEAAQAVTLALDAGYRLIDTAKVYGNEAGVGKAIRESNIPREEIFVTTKLWNTDQGYDTTLKAIDESLKQLGLDYVDLYLMHWPFAAKPSEIVGTPPNKRKETWKAMEEILQSGKAKAIGVSNFTIKHLEEMKNYATVMPAVNQIEFHPFLYQKELLEYCQTNQIIVEAYCPLVHGEKLQDELITAVAQKYGKSNAQILLRWSIQKGCIPLPKSVHKERIAENIQVFDFALNDDDMHTLDSLHENFRVAKDPHAIDP